MTTTQNLSYDHELVGRTVYALTEQDRRVAIYVTSVEVPVAETGSFVYGYRVNHRSRAMSNTSNPRRYFVKGAR